MACIDLHMHSTCSDGTDTPLVLIEKIKENQIDVFSVTDHDNAAFYTYAEGKVPTSIKLITGIEFSCVTEAGKCHILGYHMNLENEELKRAIEDTKKLRKEKLAVRLDFLEKTYGIIFSKEEREHLFSLSAAGKPHIAQILMRRGLAGSIDEAIKKYLKALPKGRDRIDAEKAIYAIAAASGTPVWAHPLGGEGERHLTTEEFQKQLAVLMHQGIRGIECFYSRYTGEEIRFLLAEAKKNNLLVSGGSDYHGTVKDIPIGKLSADEAEAITEKELTIIF